MPFNTVKSLLAEAEALLAGSGLRPIDEFIEVCGAGLGFLAREGATYSGEGGTDTYCRPLPFAVLHSLLPVKTEKQKKHLGHTASVCPSLVKRLPRPCGSANETQCSLIHHA